MNVTAEVRVPATVGRNEAEQLREDFRSIGVEPTFRHAPTSRGLEVVFDSYVWVLAIQPFVQHVVEKAAGDAYRRLKAVLRKCTEDGPSSEHRRGVLLKDEHSDVRVELEADLPADAYQLLSTMDLPATGRLRWDGDAGRWVDVDDSDG